MQAIAIRIAIMTAAILVAAVFFIATGAFLCVALFEGLKLVLTPPLAALSTAGIFLVLSLIVLWAGLGIAKAAEAGAKKKSGPATAEIGLEMGRLLGEQIQRYAGKNPIRVLVGALFVGLLLGAVPPLRKFLLGFFKKS
jgi:hypothetical protein